MPEEITVPFISYDSIAKKADVFLGKYHPSRTVPVPIEEIIEFELRINIVPLPGLHRDFDLDGFIASNLKEISVDESASEAYPSRYRFTLAHEIGHIFLHKKIFQQATFSTFAEWKKFGNSIPEKDYGWLEWQANIFAGHVLVPQEDLEKLTAKAVKKLAGFGISIKDSRDYAWEVIAENIAKDFEVSKDVIEKRFYYGKIYDKYKI